MVLHKKLKKVYNKNRNYVIFKLLKRVYDFYRYRILSDRAFIKAHYKQVFGRLPDLENPKLFSEKMQWLKLHHRTSLHTLCSDKYRVREYISKQIGDEYLVPLLFESKNVEDVREDSFPDKPFVIKQNHDSGWAMFFVKDKTEFDFVKARKEIRKAIKKNYYHYTREWQYKNIAKHIIAEELLVDEFGNLPNDYKIHCFHGEVKFVEIMTGRGTQEGVKEHCLDRNGNIMPFMFSYPQSKEELKIPAKWHDMMSVAEKLSTPFVYVRVDLYCVNDRVYFGELTFTPHSGIDMYLEPREWDEKLGDLLDLNRI